MPRIDSLTAQMRQRSVKRVSVRADEKMKLFDDQDRLLGAGAVLSGEVVVGLLSQIAPGPLDAGPLSFPYSGRDGQFEISVENAGKNFDIRVLSFTSAAPLQTHSKPQTESSAGTNQTFAVPDIAPAATAPAVAPQFSAPADPLVEWFYLNGTEQVGNNSPDQIRALIAGGQITSDTQVWSAGMAGWLPASQTEFAAWLPTPPPTDGFGNPLPVGGLAPIAPPTGDTAKKPRTYGNGPYNIYGSGDDDNTSGTGNDAEVPLEARGFFNLGAFLFPLWWCGAMNLPQFASAVTAINIASWFIPFVGLLKIPLCLYLGLMGNRMAWQMRRFSSVEDFKKCQFLWAIWSVVANVVIWGLIFAFFILPFLQMGSALRSSASFRSSPIPSGNGKPFGNLPPADPGPGFPPPGTP